MINIESIQLPENVIEDEGKRSAVYGEFEIGPLEPGYAITIGNSLRRVLLSSMTGVAIRFVKIEGLLHEYAPIPDSKSDYIDLILKLKKLIIKSNTLEEVKVNLVFKGKGLVTAENIEEANGVKILNKDLPLIEFSEEVDFRMELWVGMGRGFVPSEEQNMDNKPIGTIPIDSVYTPVKKVNFSVGNRRVGEKIDYDNLIIEIETNGSISPKNALYISAKLLKDLFAKMVLFEKEPEYIEIKKMDPELEKMENLLFTKVRELELSVRSSNCLEAAKIEIIEDLIKRTENEMLIYRNFGKKSLTEIKEILAKYDLILGMDVAKNKGEKLKKLKIK